jgi:hypothetical protein
MTKATWWGAALAGLALLGCGSTGEPGSAGADLAYVGESDLEARNDLFIDPSVSWRPMTLAQLGGESATAIPVEVDIYGGVAVAWIRDVNVSGEVAPEARRRSDIVALYRVLEHVTPVLDETVRETPEVITPGGPSYAASVDEAIDLRQELPEADRNDTDLVLIDWIDLSGIPPQQDYQLWEELQENHPGC